MQPLGNVPILLGLILSGLSIYLASPVYQHEPDPLTGNVDPLADIGIWICAHVPGSHQYSSSPEWVYNHISLGPGMLALAVVANPQVIQIGTGVSVPTSRLVWSDRQKIKPNSQKSASRTSSRISPKPISGQNSFRIVDHSPNTGMTP